jgi:hypothetical protein
MRGKVGKGASRDPAHDHLVDAIFFQHDSHS